MFSILGWAGQRAAFTWWTGEACLGEPGGVVQVACSQPDPVPSYPPSLRKLRRAGCPGEVSQLGSLAESGLIGPRSPVPRSLASGGMSSLGDWAGPNHSWMPLTWAPRPGQPAFLNGGFRVPLATTGLLSLASLILAGARGTSPGDQVLLASPGPALSGNPAAEQMAWKIFPPTPPCQGSARQAGLQASS